LVYQAPPLIARLVGRPAVAGMSVNYARLCLPFLAATMILHGRVDLESFSPARLQDPAVLALAAHVTVLADHNPDPAAFVPALLRAELVGGGVRELAVTSVLGHPGKPLEGAARMEKLRDCLTFAGLPHAADAFAERVWGFAELDDVAPVLMAATLETGETA
jgi:2-methylcitrate dehydratase PrpD